MLMPHPESFPSAQTGERRSAECRRRRYAHAASSERAAQATNAVARDLDATHTGEATCGERKAVSSESPEDHHNEHRDDPEASRASEEFMSECRRGQ